MKILKYTKAAVVVALLSQGCRIFSTTIMMPRMARAEIAYLIIGEPAADEKAPTVFQLTKGIGNEGLTIKQVSVCDQNNIWCVANDGKKDGVYQLTSSGLEYRFDGVFVSAGKELVSAINAQQEVFQLQGKDDTTWEKVEGLKLSKIYAPTLKAAWGLLEDASGKTTLYMYDDAESAWVVVQNSLGQPAQGVVQLSANAEDVALVLTKNGELFKRDLGRVNLVEKAKEVVKEKKAKKHKKGKKKKQKKAAAPSAPVAPAAPVAAPAPASAEKAKKQKKNKKTNKKKNQNKAKKNQNKKNKKNKKHKKNKAPQRAAEAEHNAAA